MSAKIIQVNHAGDYRLELTFDDGLKSTVDFKSRVMDHTEIWLPLRDVGYFKQVRIDAELQTIVWPNGLDICPDVLYVLACGRPLPEARASRPAAV
jgi:hypothetical protein